MGIPSDGSYGVAEGIISGFPVRTSGGRYEIVQGLDLDDFARGRIDATRAGAGRGARRGARARAGGPELTWPRRARAGRPSSPGPAAASAARSRTGLAARRLAGRARQPLGGGARARGGRHRRRAGGDAKGFAADVRRPEEVDRLRAAVEAWGAPPTVLVNAAGVFGPLEGVTQSDPDDWITTLEVNVVGPYLTCRAFAPADGRGGLGPHRQRHVGVVAAHARGRWRAPTRRARPPSTT